MNDLMIKNNAVGEMIHDMMMPIVEPLCMMLKQNTEALERISATLNLQGKQIEELERQVRMNTPVTGVQARYLNNAVRDKAEELSAKFGRDDKPFRDTLARKIRKDVLIRCGIASMRELPRCEYDVALKQIETWNNAVTIRNVLRSMQQKGDKNE